MRKPERKIRLRGQPSLKQRQSLSIAAATMLQQAAVQAYLLPAVRPQRLIAKDAKPLLRALGRPG